MSASPRLLRRTAPRNDDKSAVIASKAKQSRRECDLVGELFRQRFRREARQGAYIRLPIAVAFDTR